MLARSSPVAVLLLGGIAQHQVASSDSVLDLVELLIALRMRFLPAMATRLVVLQYSERTRRTAGTSAGHHLSLQARRPARAAKRARRSLVPIRPRALWFCGQVVAELQSSTFHGRVRRHARADLHLRTPSSITDYHGEPQLETISTAWRSTHSSLYTRQ